MVTYPYMKKNILRIPICRQCLALKHRIRLKKEDCIYLLYPSSCSHCHSMRNIVVDIRLCSRFKLLRGKK